jgi:hypothetical protein
MAPSIAVRCAAVAVALTITGAAFAQHPHVLVPGHWHSMTERLTVHLEGPFDIFYVNTADDPQRKKSNR